TIGLNVRKIVGYPDSAALNLAMERREVHGRATDLSTLKLAKPQWLAPDSAFHVLCQFARATRHPEFPDVPTARELARNASARARADDVTEFYKGKRINLIVSYGPGGGYDVYARVLAHHMSKYIPGNPSIVVQNMPGAGSLRGTNFLYNVAPKDGTAFGTF